MAITELFQCRKYKIRRWDNISFISCRFCIWSDEDLWEYIEKWITQVTRCKNYHCHTPKPKKSIMSCVYCVRCGAHSVWPVPVWYFIFHITRQHYGDVIMSTIASQITSVSIVYSTVCSGADQRERQTSASLAFVRGIHRWPVNSPHKGPVMQKMFPFDDVIMRTKPAAYHVHIGREILYN